MEMGERLESTTGGRPEIEIVSWNIVGLWSLNVQIEICAICRNHIMDSCVECQNGLINNEVCSISWGKCGHAFHTHCINHWLNSRNVCPLDTQQWAYDKHTTE